MKNYKNNYYTKTRDAHYCKYCDEFIPAGSEVRTINPRFEPRYWVCNECDSLIKDIIKTKGQRESTAFGDEGAVMAYDDFLGELLEKFENRCVDGDIYEKIENFVYDKDEDRF